MAPPWRYTFRDFNNLGRNKFPRQYENIASNDSYNYRWKNYYNDFNVIQRAAMFLVGHYFYREDGPPVWARSDGNRVYYYCGRENLVQPITEEYKSRIYWDQPFDFIAGSQDEDGMTLGRQLGQKLVETVLHFLFLRSGVIAALDNRQRMDRLRYFEIACLDFEPNRQAKEAAEHIKIEQDEEAQSDWPHQDGVDAEEEAAKVGIIGSRYPRRKLCRRVQEPFVKQEVVSDDDEYRPSSSPVTDVDSPLPSSRCKYLYPFQNLKLTLQSQASAHQHHLR
jgi:hypothetical protein